MDKEERKLFYAIAHNAMENGLEISLEHKNSSYTSRVLNGAFANADNRDAGLILRVYQPDGEDDDESEVAE